MVKGAGCLDSWLGERPPSGAASTRPVFWAMMTEWEWQSQVVCVVSMRPGDYGAMRVATLGVEGEEFEGGGQDDEPDGLVGVRDRDGAWRALMVARSRCTSLVTTWLRSIRVPAGLGLLLEWPGVHPKRPRLLRKGV